MGDRPLACHHSTDCAGSCTRKGIRMPYFSAHRQEHRIYMPEGNLYKSHHKYPGGEAAKFRCIICHLNTWGGGVQRSQPTPRIWWPTWPPAVLYLYRQWSTSVHAWGQGWGEGEASAGPQGDWTCSPLRQCSQWTVTARPFSNSFQPCFDSPFCSIKKKNLFTPSFSPKCFCFITVFNNCTAPSVFLLWGFNHAFVQTYGWDLNKPIGGREVAKGWRSPSWFLSLNSSPSRNCFRRRKRPLDYWHPLVSTDRLG